MKYLLDTHILLWALSRTDMVPEKVKQILLNRNNDIYYSVISPWEIEIKHLKRPEEVVINCSKLCHICDQSYYNNLKIENKHINELRNIVPINPKIKHNDPFDKMLLAQAISEDMILITHDRKFNNYKCKNILIV